MRLILALRLVLALAVALTSVHTAIGRAEARGAADLVICADGAIATVSVDASGKPVVHQHGCPDCVLGGLALLAGPAAPPAARRRLEPAACRACRGRLRATRRPQATRARGPPDRL